MKTLATVLATPLFRFTVIFFSYCTFGCRFRPPEAAFFLSATATRSHLSGPNPRPVLRCQPPLLRPDRTFQAQTRDQIAAVSLVYCAPIVPFRPKPATSSPLLTLFTAPRSHISSPNPRPDRSCQPCLLRPDRPFQATISDPIAAVSPVFCAQTAPLKPKPATSSPLSASFPVPRPRLVHPQSRSDRACSLHRRAPTAAVSPKPATQTAPVSSKPAICARLLPSNPRSAHTFCLSFCTETQLLCPPFFLHLHSHLSPLQPYSHLCLLFTALFRKFFSIF